MKEQDHFMAFSIRVNKEEREVLRKLKYEHGINISGTVKIFLKEKLEELDKLKNSKTK
jgi:hypothetical protein